MATARAALADRLGVAVEDGVACGGVCPRCEAESVEWRISVKRPAGARCVAGKCGWKGWLDELRP